MSRAVLPILWCVDKRDAYEVVEYLRAQERLPTGFVSLEAALLYVLGRDALERALDAKTETETDDSA